MTDEFDVFLSYNGEDVRWAEEIARHLEARGLRVWLDRSALRPGLPWLDGLEQATRKSKALAVLAGAECLGAWQRPEIQAFRRRAARKLVPIIPVLLPGCPDADSLEAFLSDYTWVDLRQGVTEEGLARLVWGIRGRGPDGAEAEDGEVESASLPRGLPSLGRSFGGPPKGEKNSTGRWIGCVGLGLLGIMMLVQFFPWKPVVRAPSELSCDLGVCNLAVIVRNLGGGKVIVTGLRYRVLSFQSFKSTTGRKVVHDLLGEIDLSGKTIPSETQWWAATPKAIDVVDGHDSRPILWRITAREWKMDSGLWRIQPVLETDRGDIPLKEYELMLPEWDSRQAREKVRR